MMTMRTGVDGNPHQNGQTLEGGTGVEPCHPDVGRHDTCSFAPYRQTIDPSGLKSCNDIRMRPDAMCDLCRGKPQIAPKLQEKPRGL